MNKYINLILVTGLTYLSSVVVDNVGYAVAAEQAKTSKRSVKVPAMRNRVYTQLARAQGIADSGNVQEGLQVLDEVKERISSMNSYEVAMLWNFYGFMHYSNDDLPAAVKSFQQVVAQQAIPESLKLSTLYSLAQLSMQQEKYTETLNFLTQWQNATDKPLTSDQHILFAQVHYQNKSFPQSLQSVEQAIALVKENNQLPKENWLILQRANYYELKQPEKVTQVLEQLVRYYENPTYWIQLSGMYGEIGEETKQLATMEAAWQAGFITKSQDILTLVQLYRYNNVPYKAAIVLENAIAQGKVVPSEQYLEMLGQSFIAAKNDEKALPVFKKASAIAETGKIDAQLAQTYFNMEQWQAAITSASNALTKQGISRQGDMHLIIGMSQFNLQNYDLALDALTKAKTISSSAKTAEQWFKYVMREKHQKTQLAMLN